MTYNAVKGVHMNLKKTLATLSLVSVLSLALAQPAMAANPLQNFANSFKARLNRLYLQLPGDKSASAVLDQTVMAMNNLKTAETSAGVTVVVLNMQDQEAINAKLNMAGPMEVKDIYDPMTAKQDSKITGELTMQGTTLKGDLDLKLDGETVYINAHQLPVLPYMDLSKIQGQWLKFDTSRMSEAKRREYREVTIEMRQQMDQAFRELVAKSQLSPARKERQDNHNVFAIEIAMPDSALAEYVDKIAEIEGIPAEDRTEQQVATKKALDAMADLKVKVWIDRSNYFVRKFEAPLSFDIQKWLVETGSDPSTATATPFGSLSEMKTLNITLAGTMDRYNQPVSFEVPTEARDFQEVMMEVMGPAMMGETVGRGAQPSSLQTMPKIPASELKNLSPEEKKILEQYGIDPNNL
jgi:hypothetical protein